MKVEEGALKATATEITALAEHLGLRRGALAVLPEAAASPTDRQDAARAFNSLDVSAKKGFSSALGVLNSPGKVVQLNYAIGESAFGQMLLAWSPASGDSLSTLMREGENLAVGSRPREVLQDTISGFLFAQQPLREDKIRISLPTEAALAFLAACDNLRRGQLTGLLEHRTPAERFTAGDICARLKDAAAEDDRWPLNFLDKFLPIPMGKLEVAEDPKGALGELVKVGLVEAPGGDSLYSFTENGRLVADSLLRDASKVGLAVTALTPERLAAQDAVLFARTRDHLFCFYLSGSAGLLAALGGGDLSGMTGFLLGPVPVPPEQPMLPVGEGMEATVVPGSAMEKTLIIDETIDLVPLTLVIEGGPSDGKSYALLNGGTLGRAPDNDIVINDPGVSRKHASFTRGKEGEWLVTDLGSSNGTHVNDEKIQEPKPLAVGDEIRVCNTVLRFTPPA